MFIDRQEAEKRLKNSSRLLNTIKKENSSSNGNGKENGSPISETPATDTSEEIISEGTLKGLLNIQKRRAGPKMSTKEAANLGIAGVLLGGRVAGQLLDRGPDTSHELRHGYRNQNAMYPVEGERTQDQELVNELNRQKKEVRDLAFDRITSAVGLITHEKLEKVTDVVKLARVSRDLITVVDKTLPKDEAQNNSIHFHLWKPEMKEESHYEVINVNSPK